MFHLLEKQNNTERAGEALEKKEEICAIIRYFNMKIFIDINTFDNNFYFPNFIPIFIFKKIIIRRTSLNIVKLCN